MATLRDELDFDTSRHLRLGEIAERVQIEREHDPDAELGHTSGGHGDSLARETREHRRLRAEMWRRGRAALRASPNASKLAAEWQRSPVPGSAEYMLDFLRRRGVSVPSR